MKRIMKLLFLALCQIPIVSVAVTITWDEGGFSFSADTKNDYCTVTATTMTGDVVIPSTATYNGVVYTVSNIKEWFICKKGNYNNIETITTITIPATVTSIKTGAFGLSSSIKEIIVEEGNPQYCSEDGVLYNADKTSIEYYPAKKEAGNYVIPSTIKYLSGQAFSNNQSLTSVSIPASIISIDAGNVFLGTSVGAFANCKKLTTVIFEDNSILTSIPSRCFGSSSLLSQIELPSTIVNIENYSFDGCTSLNISMPPNLETIGEYAFQSCTSMSEVIFPKTMKKLDNNAFYYCKNIKRVIVPEECDVTIIPQYCFYQSNQLEELRLSGKITKISDQAFTYCYKLPEVNLPAELKTIGPMAFYDGKVLENITFNDKLEIIYYGAFAKCSKLKSIDLPQSLTQIRMGAFMATAIEKVIIPAKVAIVDPCTFAETANMTEIIVEEGNTAYTSVDGVLFTKDMKTLLSYPAASVRDVSYTVPYGVTVIQEGAFSYARFSHVTLPSSLTTIYNAAFEYCKGLRELTIPESVTSIGVSNNSSTYYSLPNNNIIQGSNVLSLYMLNNTKAPVMPKKTGVQRAYVVPNRNNTIYNARFPVVYVKKTAYDNSVYQSADMWNVMTSFAYEIPVTMPASGLKTMGRDFDVDLSSSDLKAYVCTSISQTGNLHIANMKPIAVEGKTNGEYVPARTGLQTIGGVGYETYVGVILKGGESAISTYRIGENEDATTSQDNYLVAATDATKVRMTETKNGVEYTNLGLNSGFFKYFTSDGTIAYNKCWLSLPASIVGTYDETAANGRQLTMQFLENDITTISPTTADATSTDNNSYYTLQGVRTETPQRGFYIYKGKKIIIK